jgi:hypothetical protein
MLAQSLIRAAITRGNTMNTHISRSGNAQHPHQQSTPKAKTIGIDEKEWINPMITRSGDTFRVSSAITALACLLEAEPTMEPDSAQAYGLSVLLATCAAALCHMGQKDPA